MVIDHVPATSNVFGKGITFLAILTCTKRWLDRADYSCVHCYAALVPIKPHLSVTASRLLVGFLRETDELRTHQAGSDSSCQCSPNRVNVFETGRMLSGLPQ